MNEPRPEDETSSVPRSEKVKANVQSHVPLQSIETPVAPVRQLRRDRHEAVLWWLKLVLQPFLFLALAVLLLVALGLVQRFGGFASWSTAGPAKSESSGGEPTRYICPMMCTPPQSEPGRCPVCAMELVPATAGGSGGRTSIEIDSVARRVANIQTVSVKETTAKRTIRAIGELNYDEGALKTIAAYVAGRIESLYADYTGVLVNKGDQLALVYSPRLYSSQVELLLASKAREGSRSSTLVRVAKSNQGIYESARQRLTEFGMTEQQIAELETNGEANSRLHLVAPISGTVIDKLAVEGQYVKEGQAIYKLADLKTLWLMLELFPDDATAIRYGQNVTATVHSIPGREFFGRVAFVDPNVNPATRTVGVRVVIPNPDRQLRVGDYANATIVVRAAATNDQSDQVYDAQLAGKWISPRHPHIVRAQPGTCPLCGVELVPASEFGFADSPVENTTALVVPRDAVLMAGDNSVVYVETRPGRFEFRRVVLGASLGDEIVILQGVTKGEQVATRGNFLIDSQMQLAGNPSLIDPTKVESKSGEQMSPEVMAALAELPAEDRTLAEAQRICPVSELPLGSMGTPIKVDVDGTSVFICCDGCREPLLADPQKHLVKLEPRDGLSKKERKAIAEALAPLSPEDRELAQQQRNCPVADVPLGSMGTPIKVDVDGTPVFICCDGCRASLLQDSEKYLAKLREVQAPSVDSQEEMDLPPIQLPEMIELDEDRD